MKQKDGRNFKERAQDLQKVLTWCIIRNIKKHYETLDNFKKTYSLIKNGRASSEQQVHFCRRFGFDSNVIIRKVLGKTNGKWVKLSDIKPYLDKWIHYRHSNTKHYRKTGKHFAVHSYWYIDFDVIERYIDDADVADCKSRFYTKEQHHLINRLFLKQKTKKQKNKSKEQTTGKIKLYDNPDDIDWQNEVPEDEKARDAWINEHCSEACKQKLREELEASLKQQLSDKDVDYGAETEKVKKLLADAESVKCANANNNDDIDESEAMVIPTNNSQKVIEFALKKRGTKDEYVSFVISKKLVPIDDSFRFYYCKINGKSSVIEPAADKIYQIDNVGNFKVGCRYYSFDSSRYKYFLEKRNNKYFYANRYLAYVWKNNNNDYSRIQCELSKKLGYRAIRDLK